MSSDNTETGIGRRRLLKTSGGVLAGGLALGTIASSASASPDLDLESDFQEVGKRSGSGTTGDKYVDSEITIYRPKLSADLSRDGYRAANVELEIGSLGPEHYGATITMDGKNGAYLDGVGPGNSESSVSTTYTVGSEVGLTDVSVSTSASRGLTRSSLHIEDNSEPRNEKYVHDYTFSGGLQNNHITIDGLALFRTYAAEQPEDIIDIDWEITTESGYTNPSDSYTYTYYEGNLD